MMTEQEFERQIAPQKAALFERQFGENYRLLAYHAALPLVLTPELLHYLRTEFLLDLVPWEAEADLLLSDLCSQVGYELYAMDTAVRSYLLEEMQKDDRIPPDRMQAVAQVLISYVTYLSHINPGQREREIQAQRWAAMGYLGDESCRQMAAEIAEQFEASGEQGSSTAVKAEFARLARITQEMESQLREQPELVAFARRVGRSLRSPETLTAEERQQTFVVGDRVLRLPGVKPDLEVDNLPGLQTFEFDVAEFVETEEVASVSARPLQQVAHEFEVATIEVQTKPKQRKSRQRSQPELKTEIVIRREAKQDWQYVESLAEGLALELVKIPAGSFVMGAAEEELESYSNERPQHEVTVSEFYMGKYPVTQVQWRFVASLPEVERSLDSNPSNFKGDDRPVEQVSWLDAVEFCARLSQHTGRDYRLPTEAEWEYACRAGTTTPFHFGETIDAEIANYCAQDREISDKMYSGKYGQGQLGEYREQTTLVGSFKVANLFGLHDMHGNVWEWCQDHWHGNYEGAPIDGSAWLNADETIDGFLSDETIDGDPDSDEMIDGSVSEIDRRLLRGGSWFSFPQNCRSAYRFRDVAGYRVNTFGFRVVFSARILL